MADLSSEDRRRIEQAVAEAEAGGAAAADTRAAPMDIPDLIKFFCDNWPKVKGILQLVLPFLPEELKGKVEFVIRAGDGVHRRICT